MSRNEPAGRITGILGRDWRASVQPWGDIVPWDGSESLVWSVAADDRWYFPHSESTTRQVALFGTPVLETRVRVPGGDVVQRVWSGATSPSVSSGTTKFSSGIVLEFTNDSPMAVAIALSRGDVVTPRTVHRTATPNGSRPWPSADRGIGQPPIVMPLGHRATLRVVLPMQERLAPEDLDTFADSDAVARGWIRITDRASRFEVPVVVNGVSITERIRSRRCDIALTTGRSRDVVPADDARWVVEHRERVRMDLEDIDVPGVVSTAEHLLRLLRKKGTCEVPSADALRSCAVLLGRSDRRALDDLERGLGRALRRHGDIDDVGALVASLPSHTELTANEWGDADVDVIGCEESAIAIWSATHQATLLPCGIRTSWRGVDIEAHGLWIGPDHSVSLAVRWHGAHPAVIWEVTGPPGLKLLSGVDRSWSSSAPSGETLWDGSSIRI